MNYYSYPIVSIRFNFSIVLLERCHCDTFKARSVILRPLQGLVGVIWGVDYVGRSVETILPTGGELKQLYLFSKI
jgi:hypothetical protein